jgi:hypothetical protein
MNTLEKNHKEDWSASSWKKLKISQQPTYPDSEKVEQVTKMVFLNKLVK